ncbi:hypothetical protein [Actinomadura rupiterrae]|uniref:hypothetical protein n=1 Tax=Actinomadura rupiterrae TaxID=559627 RepID=UPI0020A4863F|nr:hypothetical protein [Actinomadura rupiterrae]MCP2337499.1 hypothetical protein [Actinomadura rupiterrae]
MNDETEALLLDVVARVSKAVETRDCPAIVVLDGNPRLVLSDYDYLRNQATARAFERRAADKAKQTGATRWALAVPMVWLITPDSIAARPVSNHPLREGEQEVIMWTTCDLAEGVDYGRVPYTRRPDGTPVFDDPEIVTVALRPSEHTLGHTLLRVLCGTPPG